MEKRSTEAEDARVTQDEDEPGDVKVVVNETDHAVDEDESVENEPRRGRWPIVIGASVLAVIIALTVTSAVLWKDHTRLRDDAALGQRYLQAARQGVLDLTSISADTVDADTQRVLGMSTGAFRDDFDARAEDFVSVVKQANVTAVGSITEAGLESMDSGTAKVLVAASSKVTNSSGAQEEPRVWRLRVTVTDDNGALLMSDVEFVP